MNAIDIIIILLVIFTVLRGVEVGLVRQASSLIGLIGGIFLGSAIASRLDIGPGMQSLFVVTTIIFLIIISELLGLKAKQWLDKTLITHADKALGGAMGVITCLALVWLGSTLISAMPAPAVQQGIRDSRIIRWLDSRLPPATDVLSQLERSFAETGLPELFGANEPDLNPGSARLPELDAFGAIVNQARPSIVEIEGRSCQGIGVGSGFVVAEDLIMTNAHVIAGMRTPYIRDDNGRQIGEVVAFNKDLDIAVLRVKDPAGAPLELDIQKQAPGGAAVVLGYPNGGPFMASPARIVEIFTAVGRDIYGEAPIERDVYALRADIKPGNSGGPVLDEDGDVIGVIFARSTEYDGVGYAVLSDEVDDVVTAAVTNPSPGESRRCLAN